MDGRRAALAALAAAVAASAVQPASAAQLDAFINPAFHESAFKIKYLKTLSVEYPDGGAVADLLRGASWTVSASASSDDADGIALAGKINQRMIEDGSAVQVTSLDATYEAVMRGTDDDAKIDFKVEISGKVSGYSPYNAGQESTLVDISWRGISAEGPVMIDGMEVNRMISAIASQEPELRAMMAGSGAEALLSEDLIDGSGIRDQPIANWHFLFDPTGINVDAGQFGLDESIAGFVVSSYTMGESGLREGRQVEAEEEATFAADIEYTVTTFASADIANLNVVGYANADEQDGRDVLWVRASPLEDTEVADFSVAIVYGMAGMAAIGGVAFFLFSSRQVKKQKDQGQTGIDPSRLRGYQTSASSGGYRTNRGEAQLIDDDSYEQHRSVYDDGGRREAGQLEGPSEPAAGAGRPDPTCGCAASADSGSECDCAMQGSCLCDATCDCSAPLCRENADLMR